jgi:hypothetical protein
MLARPSLPPSVQAFPRAHQSPAQILAKSDQRLLVLFADGSGHFISDRVNIATWQALGSRNGGEAVGEY